MHDTELPKEDETIIIRNFSQANQNNFAEELMRIDWNPMYIFDNAQQAYDMFHRIICGLFEKCFPKICIKPGYKTRKPWLSDDLKCAGSVRCPLLFLFRSQPDTESAICVTLG